MMRISLSITKWKKNSSLSSRLYILFRLGCARINNHAFKVLNRNSIRYKNKRQGKKDRFQLVIIEGIGMTEMDSLWRGFFTLKYFSISIQNQCEIAAIIHLRLLNCESCRQNCPMSNFLFVYYIQDYQIIIINDRNEPMNGD